MRAEPLRATLLAVLAPLLLSGCLSSNEMKSALVGPKGVPPGCGRWQSYGAIHIGDSVPACADDASNGYYYAVQSTAIPV